MTAVESSPVSEVIMPEEEDQFGFCRGVVAADQLLSDVTAKAKQHGIATVYSYHDIVHNRHVRKAHEEAGVVFTDEVEKIPDHSIVVTSAHGVSPMLEKQLDEKDALRFDASCPLVKHTHNGIKTARRDGHAVLYICQGKPGEVKKLHDEIEGTVGHMDYVYKDGVLTYAPVSRLFIELGDDPLEVADMATKLSSEVAGFRIVSQTTLDSDAVLSFREQLESEIQKACPDKAVEYSAVGDVCRAVADRQQGVRVILGKKPDTVLVVTDPHSKNGMGYADLARKGGHGNVLAVAGPEDTLEGAWGRVAVTASASTPDSVTRAVVEQLGGEMSNIERPAFHLNGARPEIIGERVLHFATSLGRVG